MTEHIINFAVGIEDDAIIKNVMAHAEKSIINDLKEDVINALFEGYRYGTSATTVNRSTGDIELVYDARLKYFAKELIKETFAEYKDEIIECSAKLLADSYKRTKAWREKASEVME